jgi:PhnB protein
VLEVDDVDAAYAAAVAAGATADRVPTDQGDERRGWLVDPYGHRWALESRLG